MSDTELCSPTTKEKVKLPGRRKKKAARDRQLAEKAKWDLHREDWNRREDELGLRKEEDKAKLAAAEKKRDEEETARELEEERLEAEREAEREKADHKAALAINKDLAKHAKALTTTDLPEQAWNRHFWTADDMVNVLTLSEDDDIPHVILTAAKRLEEHSLTEIENDLVLQEHTTALKWWPLPECYFDVSKNSGKEKKVVICRKCKLSALRESDGSFDGFVPMDWCKTGRKSDRAKPSKHDWYTPKWQRFVDNSKSPETKRKMVCFDCEMVRDAQGESMLASIAVVDVISGEVLCNTLIHPERPVDKYLTSITGLTPELIEAVERKDRNKYMQREHLIEVLARKYIGPETILAGWGIANDLKALKIWHPRIYDMQLVYARDSKGGRHHRRQGRLQFAAGIFGMKIQEEGHYHTALEDADATAELIRRSSSATAFLPYVQERDMMDETLSDRLQAISDKAILLRALYHSPPIVGTQMRNPNLRLAIVSELDKLRKMKGVDKTSVIDCQQCRYWRPKLKADENEHERVHTVYGLVDQRPCEVCVFEIIPNRKQYNPVRKFGTSPEKTPEKLPEKTEGKRLRSRIVYPPPTLKKARSDTKEEKKPRDDGNEGWNDVTKSRKSKKPK